jgi:hypothetical protein
MIAIVEVVHLRREHSHLRCAVAPVLRIVAEWHR